MDGFNAGKPGLPGRKPLLLKLTSPEISFNPAKKYNFTRALTLALTFVSFFLLIVKVLFSLNIIWQIFNFPFQVDESEGMIVAETLLMDRGNDIYALLNPDRFIAAPYTPFYYLLNWPALHFLGASFKPGRFISILAAFGIAFLIYQLILKASASKSNVISERPDRLTALLGALFWGSLGLVGFWGGAVKPDMLALFLSLAGLFSIYYFTLIENTGNFKRNFLENIKTDRWLYFGAAFFALSILTKQTAFAGPVSCGVFLALRISPKKAFRFAFTWAVLGFGPMLLMNLLSNGGFWYHIITVHQLPWNSETYLKFFGGFVQNYQVLLFLAFVLVIIWFFQLISPIFSRKKSLWEALRENRFTLFVLYLGASWGTGLSAGTYGGNHNHLLEFAAACCLSSGLFLAFLREKIRGAPRFGKVYSILLFLVILQILGLFVGEARVKPANFPLLGAFYPGEVALDLLKKDFGSENWLGLEYRAPLAGQREGFSQVAAFMTNDVGPLIYSDNVSLMIASGKPILTTDPFTQTHATELKRWDESYLLSLVETKKFHLIVLRSPIEQRLKETGQEKDIYLTSGLAKAILKNYKLTRTNVAFIYEPKD